MAKRDIRLLIPGLAINPVDPFATSLGGCETAGLQLASALGALGHTITCFCEVEGNHVWQGVNLVPTASFTNTFQSIPADLTIVQRAPPVFIPRGASKLNFLWVHDLLFARRKNEFVAALHSIDKVLTVSRWQLEQYRRVCPEVPEGQFFQIRNGIDLGLVEQARANVEGQARDMKLIVCIARLERGTDVLLLHILPKILERIPEARLAVAMYDVPNPGMDQFYTQVQHAAKAYGDRVQWHGALGKVKLYELLHSGGLYLYPTPSPGDTTFAETSCIAVTEAMACGLPVVAANRGALAETIGEAGILVDYEGPHCASEQALEAFTAAACDVLLKPNTASALIAAGRKRAQRLGWAPVAEAVLAEADRLLAEQCSDPVRLARHFIRNQDIEAARVVVETVKIEGQFPVLSDEKRSECAEIESWLATRFRHTNSPEALAAYYADKVGPGNGHVFDALMHASASRFNEAPFVRFEMLDKVLRSYLQIPADQIPNGLAGPHLIDFGCSQGEGPIALSNRLGAKVLGIDASPSEVERARRLADKHAIHPDRLTFVSANEAPASWNVIKGYVEEHGLFDAAICAECMEHLIDPVTVVEFLEGLVRPGGVVAMTMPFGPWETQQLEVDRGQHLRMWDLADLRDVFGGKPDLVVDRAPLSRCPVTGEVLGNLIISYRADGQPLRPIDWRRKLSTQAPRQTLSAAMIVGGASAHECLHWCLGSLRDVADEIVIVDCGMTEEARRIAGQYQARILPGTNPLQIGFAAARNIGLDACRGDWVLQIDSDERLVSGAALYRYLRPNIYHSYSLPQHHLAVDAQWPPDLPGRVFRRGADINGNVLKFHGFLHEHPEFAINKGAGLAMVLPDVRLAHVGYIDQDARAHRFVRNLPMLQRDLTENPDRELGLLVVCRDSMIQAKWLLLTMGIDPNRPGAALGHELPSNLCRDVIGIWGKVFADNAAHLGNACLEHYHEACRMLGTEVIADVDRPYLVNRQGVGAIGIKPEKAIHFANLEHYERAMATRVKGALQPVSGEGY